VVLAKLHTKIRVLLILNSAVVEAVHSNVEEAVQLLEQEEVVNKDNGTKTADKVMLLVLYTNSAKRDSVIPLLKLKATGLYFSNLAKTN
jgi:hypothetical protein